MGSLRISQRTVEGLPVESRDAIFWDRELLGFGVRVYPSGARVYVVQTRSWGRSRRVTVGRHGVLSAARARRRAAPHHRPHQGRRGAPAGPGEDGARGQVRGHGRGPRAAVLRPVRGGALQAIDPALLPGRPRQVDPAVAGGTPGARGRARARRCAALPSSRDPVPGEPGAPRPEQDVRPGRGMGPAGPGVASGPLHPQVPGAPAGAVPVGGGAAPARAGPARGRGRSRGEGRSGRSGRRRWRRSAC